MAMVDGSGDNEAKATNYCLNLVIVVANKQRNFYHKFLSSNNYKILLSLIA